MVTTESLGHLKKENK
uniref:Uncharacterized protein n=1 Tax=Arundo donax TaxID=35708 RepID=A0A0A9HH66_ARUDO